MDLAWLRDFGGFIKDLATVILPIVGVMVGAKLASRSADEQWLKKERLTAYLELIFQLDGMLKHFAAGMRVSKFGYHVESHDHSADIVEDVWNEQMDELERAEVKAKMLGGKLGTVYDSTANSLLLEMLEAIEDPDITEREWRSLSMRGHTLKSALQKSAQADLGVPVHRVRKRPSVRKLLGSIMKRQATSQ